MRLTKPRRKKRARTHGFLKRSRKTGGRRVLRARRRKGRWQLTRVKAAAGR